MTSLKRGLSAFEAIINGMFGILLCVMIGLLPLLSLERKLPWMPAGQESVIILLLACLVLEGVNIWRILTAHLDPESPPGPSAALRYKPFPNLVLRLLSFLWYLFHMLCAIAMIVMCKYQALHAATTRDKVMGLIFGFGMLGAFNVFLALTAMAISNSQSLVARLWRCRFLIDITFEATAFVFALAN
jgi:hypothetical protein